MNIQITTVKQLASDEKVNEGTELVDVKQAKISFDRLPQDLQELKAIDRTGENGKFLTFSVVQPIFSEADSADMVFGSFLPTKRNCPRGMSGIIIAFEEKSTII